MVVDWTEYCAEVELLGVKADTGSVKDVVQTIGVANGTGRRSAADSPCPDRVKTDVVCA